MKILFLLYTQAEGGAPGYLSRRGEEAAGNLAQTLFGFAQDTLLVNLDAEYEARTKSLQEDLRWRAFRNPSSFPQAIRAAHALFSDLLLVCGENSRTLKTAEPVSQMCALPVCVDPRFDRCSDDLPRTGTLTDALQDFVEKHVSDASNSPRCVWVGTSQKALKEWLKTLMDEQKWLECIEVLEQSTQNDLLPAVFACGYEKTADSNPRWIID
ncbi:MAG: hypothetical protein ACO3A4_02280 [Silvanigrellaceae bacterium]